MRNTILDKIAEEAGKNKDIVFLTGDLGYNCIERFSDRFPDRYFNCGIAEQNMLEVAAGLAASHKKVFVYSIGNFDTLRVLEQIRNDICYMNLDVNIIAVGAGMEYGSLGFSHHSTEDIACMRALPNMSVFSPSTVKEAVGVADAMLNNGGPKYVRLCKKGIGEYGAKTLGVTEIKKGNDIAILGTGTILEEAILASDILKKSGIQASVYSFPVIKPKNTRAIKKIAENHKFIFTLEEHNIVGGFGSSVAETLAETEGNASTLKRIGIKDDFVHEAGNEKYLRGVIGIDAESIAKEIKKVVSKK